MFFWPLLGHDFLFVVFDFSVVGIDLLNICYLMAKFFFDADIRMNLLVLFSFFGGACDFEFSVIYLFRRYYYFFRCFKDWLYVFNRICSISAIDIVFI